MKFSTIVSSDCADAHADLCLKCSNATKIRFSHVEPFNLHAHANSFKKRPRGYKLFSCSTHLSIKFIMLIIVKIPTIVVTLTFIKEFKRKTKTIFQHFSFYEQLKCRAQLSLA